MASAASTTVRWTQPLRDGRVVDVGTSLPGETIEVPTYCRAAELTATAWRAGTAFDRDTVALEGANSVRRWTRITTPAHDPAFVNALLADATVELAGHVLRRDCDGDTQPSAVALEWTLNASTAALGTGSTFVVRAGDLPAAGATYRLRYLAGTAVHDRRTLIPCTPIEGLGPAGDRRPCSDEAMLDRVRAALLQDLVAIVGEGEATPFAQLLNLADDPDGTVTGWQEGLLALEVDAGARLHEKPAVLELLLTATQTVRAALQMFAPAADDGGAGAGWDALRFATTAERAGASPLPAARVAPYAFLTAFVATYAGTPDFGASPLAAFDEALALEAAALAGVDALVAALAEAR